MVVLQSGTPIKIAGSIADAAGESAMLTPCALRLCEIPSRCGMEKKRKGKLDVTARIEDEFEFFPVPHQGRTWALERANFNMVKEVRQRVAKISGRALRS
jgi:hypothetical protein